MAQLLLPDGCTFFLSQENGDVGAQPTGRILLQRRPTPVRVAAADEIDVPVPHPDALAPQAWSAGAPLLALRTLLGLDVVGGRLRSRPRVPKQLGRIALRAFRSGAGAAVPVESEVDAF